MKSLKDFLTEKAMCPVDTIVPTPEELALMATATPLKEGMTGLVYEDIDPPTVLVMHRKAVKQLAEGQRVGIYYVDKINKYVTVPYDSVVSVTEETVIDKLKNSADNKTNIMVEHYDGTSSEVTPAMARRMIDLYKKINEANKAKMLEMLEASAKHFQTIAKFSKE